MHLRTEENMHMSSLTSIQSQLMVYGIRNIAYACENSKCQILYYIIAKCHMKHMEILPNIIVNEA